MIDNLKSIIKNKVKVSPSNTKNSTHINENNTQEETFIYDTMQDSFDSSKNIKKFFKLDLDSINRSKNP